MNISSIDRAQSQVSKIKKDPLNVLVAKRSLEAATQNLAKEKTGQANSSLKYAHPYLGHNVDIYV